MADGRPSDRARAFEAAFHSAETHVTIGHIGLRYIEMLRTVPLDKVKVEETANGWKLIAKRVDVQQALPDQFRTPDDERGVVVFDLRESGDSMSIKAIHVVRDPEQPEFVETATFETLRFAVDRNQLRLPDAPPSAVEVDALDELGSEIIDALRLVHVPPIAAPQGEAEDEDEKVRRMR